MIEARRNTSGGLDVFVEGRFLCTMKPVGANTIVIQSPHFDGAGSDDGIGPYVGIDDGLQQTLQEPCITVHFSPGPYKYDETTGRLIPLSRNTEPPLA